MNDTKKHPIHTLIIHLSPKNLSFSLCFSLSSSNPSASPRNPLSLLRGFWYRSLISARGNMKRCIVYRQNAIAGCDDGGMTRMEEAVVCPKPRRLGVLNRSINDPFTFRPIRCHQADMGDSRPGSELLDMILTKGSYGAERSINQVASSPPYFCGSPPSRVSNPVIQDAQFGNEKFIVLSPAPPSPSSSSARKGGGCARMKFGHKPAVRIEGFDCLSRDRRGCSISAVA